ncbi:MAG: hypothetical protein ABSF67_11720 [Roseiarcus sp.]|jgi:hypothetical protein
MKRLILGIALAAALCASAAVAQTPPDDCALTFYRDKSEACLSETLAALRDATSVKPEINAAMVGFLAGVIKSTPTLEAKIVAAVGPPAMKTTILMALNRAGRDEAARSFARTENLQAALAGLERELPPRLDEIKPRSAVADNDLLIGAFMATGDPAYIKAILGNFSAAKDDQIRDAVRVALMQARFGENDRRGGYQRLARVVCGKYQCRRDLSAFSRVMTLSAAYWALASLAAKDETIRKTSQTFLDADWRVKAIEQNEQDAFAAYVERLSAWTIAKSDPDSIDKAKSDDALLSGYENLGPTWDLLHPLVGDK